MHVQITRDANQILVAVPFAWRARAKKIPGYSWNPDRKLWQYPYSESTLSQLIAEFGDNATVTGADLTTDSSALREELNRIAAAVEAQKQGIADHSKNIEEYARQIEQVSEERDKALEDRKLLEATIADLSDEVSSLRAKLSTTEQAVQSSGEEQKLQQSVEFWKNVASDFEKKYKAAASHVRVDYQAPRPVVRVDPFREILNRAVALADADPDFQFTVNNSTVNRLALDIAVALEKRLSQLLATSRSEKSDFFSLIQQAYDKQLVSDEARGLLSFIRQNRNRVAHDAMPPDILWARSCISLLAAAIVWPEIAKQIRGRSKSKV